MPIGLPDTFPALWAHRTLSETLGRLAIWTWYRRAQAIRTRMSFSEETVTESILLDLKCAESYRVGIRQFNKIEEGGNGADWEWCFHDGGQGQFCSIRVQAKVLDDKGMHYSHLDRYVGNTGERQIDRFIRCSAQKGLPSIYIFYNYLADISRIPDTCCSDIDASFWGCSFSVAEAVKYLSADKSFDKIGKISRPWSCLACDCSKCQLGKHSRWDNYLPYVVADQVNKAGRSARTRLGEMNFDVPEEYWTRAKTSGKKPDYFDALVGETGELFTEGALTEGWRDEAIANYRNRNPEVGGVAIIGPAKRRGRVEY